MTRTVEPSAAEAAAAAAIGAARGAAGTSIRKIPFGAKFKFPLPSDQVVAALRPGPGLALALHPGLLAQPLQEPGGRHGGARAAGGAERDRGQIGRRAVGGAEGREKEPASV